MINLLEEPFIKNFIRICHDAWVKGWHERNGGNLSYRLTASEIATIAPFTEDKPRSYAIDVEIPNLAEEYFLVTGSGKFFRHVPLDPEANIGIIKIDASAKQYHILWGLLNDAQPTSELPTHLLNHSIKFESTGGRHRVIQHSHLTNLIALTFVLPLDEVIFTQELWQMATECAIVFPKGIGIVPWMVPGGHEIAQATGKLMHEYDVVIWAHHGIFGSGESLDITFGLLDTIEKSAEILVKVLAMGGKKQTMNTENFLALEEPFNVQLSRKMLRL